MFNGLRGKIIALAISALMLVTVLPTTALANANTPAFTSVNVGQTTINAGQNVMFQINTINASYVFASVNGGFTAATQASTNTATGETTWNLTVAPNATQTVAVYANATNVQAGAARVAVPITVVGQQQSATPQIPTGNQHRIYSITEAPATAAGNVTLTIVTDAAVNYVWISLQGEENVRPATSTAQANNQRTWTVSYRPRQAGSHQVTVNANSTWTLGGRQVSQTQTVENAAPYVPAVVTAANISRASISPSSISRDSRATITVRTNRDVQYVWATVDGRRVNARRGNITATNASWTIDVRPDRTQTITVYANLTNTATGAATDTVRVTVTAEANARIESVSPGTINLAHFGIGSANTIVVRTNAATEHVWAIVNDSRVTATGGRTVDGSREWEIVVHPQWTQNIRVYAHTRSNNNDNNAVTRSVNVVNN